MFSTDWKFRVLELNPNSGVQVMLSLFFHLLLYISLTTTHTHTCVYI